jgi:hypothetical protein
VSDHYRYGTYGSSVCRIEHVNRVREADIRVLFWERQRKEWHWATYLLVVDEDILGELVLQENDLLAVIEANLRE